MKLKVNFNWVKLCLSRRKPIKMKRETKEKMTLANLTIGAEAKVVKVLGKTAITRRLMEMGVVPGVSVKVVKAAPFGDPIQIRVLGYSLAMRKRRSGNYEISNETEVQSPKSNIQSPNYLTDKNKNARSDSGEKTVDNCSGRNPNAGKTTLFKF